ncbi:hypothetical protein LMH87_010837 [Akanthomyces muscarius]|uniref:F-box domain-containing protein n=1 Tax=Akanthomyces muscarius TaxID=2231603 RepID=A0A9W8Q8J7_AKAMU|nr:hypothetical protein LMH87_010837 [Akanthomyces muscarius]KAJ4150071.1 hypothetical protein LMH87_010837 [Akanthomyces muscarius]
MPATVTNLTEQYFSDRSESVATFTLPRKRLCLDIYGPLSSCLFDSSLERLADYLIVPVPTTTILRNIDRRFPKCQSKSPADRNPCQSSLEKRQQNSRVNETGSAPRGPDRTEKLPAEIIFIIFDNLELVEDALIFGLTCRRIWQFARRRVCEWQRKRIGPWAGEHLVAVSDHCDDDDYPPGLFSAEEINQLMERWAEEVSWRYDWESTFWRFNISSFALERVVQHITMPERTPLSRLRSNLDRQGRLPAALEDAIWHEIRVDKSVYAPADEVWMLRNLTTRELVRAEAVAIKQDLIHGPYIEKRGFHHLLLIRTAWGNPELREITRYRNHPPVPCRGPWAGHRFEICTAKHHEADVSATGAEWSDVSGDAKAELDNLWEAAYGPDWRDVEWDHKRHRPPSPQWLLGAPDRG